MDGWRFLFPRFLPLAFAFCVLLAWMDGMEFVLFKINDCEVLVFFVPFCG